MVNTTVVDNVAPVGANVGAGRRLEAFGSAIGPARTAPIGGQAQPAESNCHVSTAKSFGYNVVSDGSCDLHGRGDLVGVSPALLPLAANGGPGETRMPGPASPVLDHIPVGRCGFTPFARLAATERRVRKHLAVPPPLSSRDQRGVARPQGAGCDSGAVEVGG
jgi:hypothetical protein